MPREGAKERLASRPRDRIEDEENARRRQFEKHAPSPFGSRENRDRHQRRRKRQLVAEINHDQQGVQCVDVTRIATAPPEAECENEQRRANDEVEETHEEDVTEREEHTEKRGRIG